MLKKTLQQKCSELLSEEENVLLAEGFEPAFVGIGRQFGKPIAVYDRDKCLALLSKDMTYEDAIDYFEFNVSGAWVGEQTPIFLETLPENCRNMTASNKNN